MHIAMVVSADFPPREGMGTYVWNLSQKLIQRGHQVEIITRGSRNSALFENIQGVNIWRPFFAPLYPFHIHLHACFVNRLLHRLENHLDLLHCHSPLIPPVNTRLPVMLTFHSTVREDVQDTRITSFYALLMKLQSPVSFQIETACLQKASVVNSVSPKAAAALRTYPHSPAKIPVVWNGVDTDFFKDRPDHAPRADFILSVGRLSPGKGIEDLLEALVILAQRKINPQVIILGDGPSRQALESHTAAAGLAGQVHFLGHIADRRRLVDYYQQAALFVLPSHHEGLPTVLLEAMACGCPVITTNVGAVPDVILDGVNGILIPPAEPSILAEAIQSAIHHPQRMDELAAQGRKCIEEKFSWNQISQQFDQMYREMRPV